MPSTPPTDVIDLHSAPDTEVESRAELDLHLANASLAGLTVQGLRLDLDPVPDLGTVDLTDTLFVGCRFASREVEAELVRRGAHVVPGFPELPYSCQPGHLYTPEDLSQGFVDGGFDAMLDNVVYEHFRAHGGALPEVREALAQRMHDHGIDNALADATRGWQARHGVHSVVGVMGGHAVPRGSVPYRLAATLGWELARAGKLVVTGGGPGVMEATNLGSYLATRTAEDLTEAIDALAAAPDFHDHGPYTAAALDVRARYSPAPDGDGEADGWARRGGLAIPTWLYGHEPANLFAGRIAKYFSNENSHKEVPAEEDGQAERTSPAPPDAPDEIDRLRYGGLAIPTWLYGHEPANLFASGIAKFFSNAIREETILRLARGGIVFAPGMAGTVQEVFQAATMAFYGTNGPSGPFIFMESDHWEGLPVVPLLRSLLAASPHGDIPHLVMVTDSVEEAVTALTAPVA